MLSQNKNDFPYMSHYFLRHAKGLISFSENWQRFDKGLANFKF